MGGTEVAPLPGPFRPLGRAADPIGEASLDPHGRERAARVLRVRAHAFERVARLVTGLKLGKPAVRDLGHPLEHGLGHAAHPHRDGALDGQRVDAGPVEVMVRAFEGHHRFGQSFRMTAICSLTRRPRVWKSSFRASYSTWFQPMPTPSRRRPPVRTSTAAACLATSAVWRWGRITMPVTSSRR